MVASNSKSTKFGIYTGPDEHSAQPCTEVPSLTVGYFQLLKNDWSKANEGMLQLSMLLQLSYPLLQDRDFYQQLTTTFPQYRFVGVVH